MACVFFCGYSRAAARKHPGVSPEEDIASPCAAVFGCSGKSFRGVSREENYMVDRPERSAVVVCPLRTRCFPLFRNGRRDTLFLRQRMGLRLGGPAERYLGCGDGLHCGWACRMVKIVFGRNRLHQHCPMLRGCRSRDFNPLASTPPTDVEAAALRGALSLMLVQAFNN